MCLRLLLSGLRSWLLGLTDCWCCTLVWAGALAVWVCVGTLLFGLGKLVGVMLCVLIVFGGAGGLWF